MTRMHGIIFAYGKCPKLQTLVEQRVADSIPYAARYRIVDFTISNMVNAGVTDVGIILQDKYQSMLDHLGSGKDWDLSRKHGGLRLLPSVPKIDPSREFRGKMEALAAIESYVQRIRQEYVVLANGALICNMPLGDVLATATRFTAECISAGVRNYCPVKPDRMIVGGGGSMNPTLLAHIADCLPGCEVMTNEQLGLDSNAKEAVAFAVLANEAMYGQPNNAPGATGAAHPVVMGKISQ